MSTRRPASRVPTPVPTENGHDGRRNSVNLGPNDRLVGQLYIEGDLRVSGTVEGALEATGDIEIAGAGKVSGTVTAYNRLVVGSSASLIGGDVRVARLTVEDGATFSGHISMGQQTVDPVAVVPETLPAPAQPAETVVIAAPEKSKPKRR